MSGRQTRGQHQDRHGHGPRGPLGPPGTRVSRSRAEQFRALVVGAVDRARDRERLPELQVTVSEVPPRASTDVPLGATLPAVAGAPPRLVVYRRPVELRAGDPSELRALIRDVVAEQLADLLGCDPAEVDPGYRDPDA